MHTCSNCGTEFDDRYLQCPNCGCTRGDIRNAEAHDKRTEKIGGIIAVVFIVFLILLVSYGTYLLLNPFKSGPTVTNVVTESTTTTVEGSTTTISTTTKVTTTSIVGTEVPLGSHILTIPEGFSQSYGQLSFTPLSMYNHTENGIWIINNTTNNLMYFSISDRINIKREEEDNKKRTAELTSQGFTDLEADRFNGKLVYYATKDLGDGHTKVIMYYNKNANLVLSSFDIEGTKLTVDNLKDVLTIISTIK